MFLPISWTNYLLWIIALLAAYYAVMLIIYRNLISGFSRHSIAVIKQHAGNGSRPEKYKNTADSPQISHANENDGINALVHDFVNEIEAYTSAVGSDEPKATIIQGIRKILLKYPTLENSHLQENIEELITVSCESNCAVYLSETEIRELWRKAG